MNRTTAGRVLVLGAPVLLGGNLVAVGIADAAWANLKPPRWPLWGTGVAAAPRGGVPSSGEQIRVELLLAA